MAAKVAIGECSDARDRQPRRWLVKPARNAYSVAKVEAKPIAVLVLESPHKDDHLV